MFGGLGSLLMLSLIVNSYKRLLMEKVASNYSKSTATITIHTIIYGGSLLNRFISARIVEIFISPAIRPQDKRLSHFTDSSSPTTHSTSQKIKATITSSRLSTVKMKMWKRKYKVRRAKKIKARQSKAKQPMRNIYVVRNL